MNKQKFIELADNPSRISAKDAGILAELCSNYPYSPLVHTMLAKAKSLQNNQHQPDHLATAAIYIADRSVLKAVMEDQFKGPLAKEQEFTTHNEFAEQPSPTTISEPTGEEFNADPPTLEQVPEVETEVKKNVFEELEENLRKLKEQRNKFENQETQEQENPEEVVKETPPPTRLGTLPEPLQDLLENKEEKEINDPKRIEQINLIDSFIKNSSSISRKFRSAESIDEEQDDLTSAYAYTPPDLATENLAQIMVRQGKVEKAIDIYEKLILKYPEKKAYFATCIEKLKTPD